jgi:hypothetical protein
LRVCLDWALKRGWAFVEDDTMDRAESRQALDGASAPQPPAAGDSEGPAVDDDGQPALTAPGLPALDPPASTKLSIVTLTGSKLRRWQAAYDQIVA